MSEVFMEYIAIWAPSIASILSVVALVLPVVFKLKEWFKGLKEDNTLAEVNAKLEVVSAENKELVRCNKLLLEQITKIKDYADLKNKEG